MLDLLFYKANSLITTVVDGSIFKEKIKTLEDFRITLEEDIIFIPVLQ